MIKLEIRFRLYFGDFSYTIRTGVNTELAFGLKGGFSHYNLDQATVSQDNTLENINSWTPNLGAGIYLHSDMWYLGLSAPRFINQKYHDATDVLIEANERVSYYLTGGYGVQFLIQKPKIQAFYYLQIN